MMDLIDRNLIGDLVDSNGNVHYEDIMNIPSLELPSVQPVGKDINVSCKDAISRQDAIDAVDKLSDKPIDYLEAAIDVLVDLPSVQPDIIACGDCKHYIPHDKRCGYWNHGVQPLMWCSQAERRWKE